MGMFSREVFGGEIVVDIRAGAASGRPPTGAQSGRPIVMRQSRLTLWIYIVYALLVLGGVAFLVEEIISNRGHHQGLWYEYGPGGFLASLLPFRRLWFHVAFLTFPVGPLFAALLTLLVYLGAPPLLRASLRPERRKQLWWRTLGLLVAVWGVFVLLQGQDCWDWYLPLEGVVVPSLAWLLGSEVGARVAAGHGGPAPDGQRRRVARIGLLIALAILVVWGLFPLTPLVECRLFA